MRYVATVFLAMILAGAGAAAENEPAALLLEKGVYAEETEGNLEAATAIYEQIVR